MTVDEALRLIRTSIMQPYDAEAHARDVNLILDNWDPGFVDYLQFTKHFNYLLQAQTFSAFDVRSQDRLAELYPLGLLHLFQIRRGKNMLMQDTSSLVVRQMHHSRNRFSRKTLKVLAQLVSSRPKDRIKLRHLVWKIIEFETVARVQLLQ